MWNSSHWCSLFALFSYLVLYLNFFHNNCIKEWFPDAEFLNCKPEAIAACPLMLEIPCNSLSHLFPINQWAGVVFVLCRDFHGPHHCSECLPSTLLKTSCWDRKILLSLFCRWSAEIFGGLPTAELEIRGRVKNKTCSPCSQPLLTHNAAFFFYFFYFFFAPAVSFSCMFRRWCWLSHINWLMILLLPSPVYNYLTLFKSFKKNPWTSKLLNLLISYLIKRGGRTIADFPSYL